MTIALAGNPGGSTLLGTTSANAQNGVASFANLSLEKAATGYNVGGVQRGIDRRHQRRLQRDACSTSATNGYCCANERWPGHATDQFQLVDSRLMRR